jgi:two-component system chemotaxis sensor kinase CheA
VSTNPLDTFREEASELLQELEESLVELERDPQNADLVDGAFRSLHTIKGSGNMFGLEQTVSFTHRVEAVFDHVRNGAVSVTDELVSLGLAAADHIRALLASDEADADLLSEGRAIIEELTRLDPKLLSEFEAASESSANGAESSESSPEPGESSEEHVGAKSQKTYRITFKPSRDIFRTGTNPLSLIGELKEMGEVLVLGFIDDVPVLDDLAPQDCYIHFDLLLTTAEEENAIRDVFIFVEGDSEINIKLIDEADLFDTDLSYKRLGEILVDRGDIEPEVLAETMDDRGYLGDVLVERGYVTRESVKAALEEQKLVRRSRESRQATEAVSSIKVSTEKLDRLVNLVGEFVSMQANLLRLAGQKQDRDFVSVGEQLEALVREVRDLALEMHMVPVESLFSGYRRLVRDLAKELGKEVRLETSGTDTELDKNIIEELKDPLLHVIRNAVDHGIEDPAERDQEGKEREGLVHLSADYSGAYVVIRVKDDGKGLDSEKIRQKAVSRGLISDGIELSESQIFDLVFEPGFSTAEQATNISGRGVGMDVVKQNLENLGGTVALSSAVGEGTTLQMRIPLTLAIVEGLLATIGDTHYMIGISVIVECLDFRSLKRETKRNFINFRGELVPFIDLRELFDVHGDPPEYPQLVIVSVGNERVGLIVDAITDRFQSVVKSLGRMYEGVQGISGAVLLGDGTPALMLDVDRLARIGGLRG